MMAHVLAEASPRSIPAGEPLRAIRKWRDISSISTLGLNALINPSLGHRPLTVIWQHRGKERRHYSYLLGAFKDITGVQYVSRDSFTIFVNVGVLV